MVERPAVNRQVTGSSPVRGAFTTAAQAALSVLKPLRNGTRSAEVNGRVALGVRRATPSPPYVDVAFIALKQRQKFTTPPARPLEVRIWRQSSHRSCKCGPPGHLVQRTILPVEGSLRSIRDSACDQFS